MIKYTVKKIKKLVDKKAQRTIMIIEKKKGAKAKMKNKKINNNCIVLSNQIIESEIFQKPPLYLKVWVYLLARAQHDDYKKLKRGQLSTTIPEIQKAVSWKVGYRTETPSKSQIFRIINWLRNPNERDSERKMIETKTTTRLMLITINDYEAYQDY